MNCNFSAVVLIGSEDAEKCDSNIFPLASSPTRMLGRFSKLNQLKHENLCEYLQLIRCNAAINGVILISEHYEQRYLDLLKDTKELDIKLAARILYETSLAIEYCHESRVIIGHLALENILLCVKQNQFYVKLSQYGLYHVSGNNYDVDYVIGSPWYFSPERLFSKDLSSASYKSDVWAMGIFIVEIFTRNMLSDIWGVKQIFSVLEVVYKKANRESALNSLLNAIKFACPLADIRLPDDVAEIAGVCLQILPSKRPSAEKLRKMIGKLANMTDLNERKVNAFEKSNIGESIEEMRARIQTESIMDNDFSRSLDEMFFLWKLCGSSVESILIKKGLIQLKPPVCIIPSLITGDFQMFGNEEARKINTNLCAYVLPNDNLKNRLKSFSIANLCLCHELESELTKQGVCFSGDGTSAFDDMRGQTLVVKERYVDYQVYRMQLFKKLLAAFPYNSDVFRETAKDDIPPFYRGRVWAALLNVFDDLELREEFYSLNVFAEHVSDRQLQVDIPRCHQYDELMTSPVAHYKLKVLLKAWLVWSANNNTGCVYWQGLDSLAAPFLVLNFNNIPVAFRCLTTFIDRYLKDFFLQDNSDAIQRYLEIFSLLVEFIDPELANHLTGLDFRPQLFAIPWFLTCFAHVLPLHKLFHLWDSLLLADASFPLFIGCAILIELRPYLISAQFNDAILLFSDLPDISIDNVVANSNSFYNFVPESCTHSEHSARHCLPSLRAFLLAMQKAESN